MMTRNRGLLEFECDGCGEVLESETEDFEQARGVLRSARWSSTKVGNEWQHMCSNCYKTEARR